MYHTLPIAVKDTKLQEQLFLELLQNGYDVTTLNTFTHLVTFHQLDLLSHVCGIVRSVLTAVCSHWSRRCKGKPLNIVLFLAIGKQMCLR